MAQMRVIWHSEIFDTTPVYFCRVASVQQYRQLVVAACLLWCWPIITNGRVCLTS